MIKKLDNGTFILDEKQCISDVFVNVGQKVDLKTKLAQIKAWKEAQKHGSKS